MRCRSDPRTALVNSRFAEPALSRLTSLLGSLLARVGLGICLGLMLSSCGKSEERAAANHKLLSTDIHVSIAQHHLVLPFVALEDYQRRGHSFSLNRKEDAERAAAAFRQLMRDSQNPQVPKPFDRLSVTIETYGWDEADMRRKEVCRMLTRQWTLAACDNPWAAIQQSLPDTFELVDLRRLKLESPEPRVPRCARDSTPRRAFPTTEGEAVTVCEEEISGAKPHEHFVAVLRIDGDLGAAWSVYEQHQRAVTAQAMAARQGKAILALVRYGLGSSEDFSRLYETLCQLRAPPLPDPVPDPRCGDAARR
jgi:hypothetical protein